MIKSGEEWIAPTEVLCVAVVQYGKIAMVSLSGGNPFISVWESEEALCCMGWKRRTDEERIIDAAKNALWELDYLQWNGLSQCNRCLSTEEEGHKHWCKTKHAIDELIEAIPD